MTRHDTTGTRALTVVLLCTAVLALVALVGIPVDEAGREIGVTRETTTTTAPTTTSTTTTSTTSPSTTRPATSTTVAPQATAPAVAVEPSVGDGSCGGWLPAISRHFPADQVGRACEIARCESDYVATAVSHTNDHGAFQLHAGSGSWPRGWQDEFERVTGVPFFDGVYDPALNIQFAGWLYAQSGWTPWACAR